MANMKYARNGHAVCAVKNSHLVVTGTRIGKGSTCEIFNIETNTWSDLPEMNLGRYYHSSCSFNSTKIFVFCGIEAISKKY
jgi:hypothetical protein